MYAVRMSRDRSFIVNLPGTAGTSTSNFDLLCTIWPNSGLTDPAFRENEYTAFLAHLNQESSYLGQNNSEFAVETTIGTIDLIPILRDNISEPRGKLVDKFAHRFPNVQAPALLRTIELVIRLWLTIRVSLNDIHAASPQANHGMLEWPAEISLIEAVQSQFFSLDSASNTNKSLSPILDPSFAASTLIDVFGIKLSWTSNLMDHLRLDKRHRVLTVYEHKICLLNHIKGNDSPFPVELLQESIDTLNLLFPFGHGPTRELLRRENKMALYGLGTCNRERRLNIGDYRAWRTQITSLIEIFNEPPRNWWQLFSDRRDLREWATFWLGPMVLILTVVSIINGTVSSVYAVKQYNLSRLQAYAACDM